MTVAGAQPDHDEVVIWAPQRAVLTVVLGLPGIIVSASVFGFSISGLVDVSLAILVASCVGAAVVAVRVAGWGWFAAQRSVAVSGEKLLVRHRSTTVGEIAWADVASIKLICGDTLLRMTLSFIWIDADFPRIIATPKDQWAGSSSLPPLLALVPGERDRLKKALAASCSQRSIPFEADARH